MSLDALPTGLRQQGEKNTFSLYTCIYYSAYIKKMYFFIGNRKFIVENKYIEYIKKCEPHFLSD